MITILAVLLVVAIVIIVRLVVYIRELSQTLALVRTAYNGTIKQCYRLRDDLERVRREASDK
jgi:predicted Holliday junction resolvase-like endonuclease